MPLPATVHTFPFEMDFGDQTMVLHPAGIETARGLLLLDTGMPHTVGSVLEQVGEAGFDVGDIPLVLLTHQDGDHAGGLSAILEEGDPTVLAHETAAPVVDGREDPRVQPGEERYPPARVDVELTGGETIHTNAGPARVIETPGHTPGHVSVYLPDEKLLIAGDALGNYDGVLSAPDAEVTMDTDAALASIATLAQLDVEQILCYHGGLIEEGTARLEAIVAEGY